MTSNLTLTYITEPLPPYCESDTKEPDALFAAAEASMPLVRRQRSAADLRAPHNGNVPVVSGPMAPPATNRPSTSKSAKRPKSSYDAFLTPRPAHSRLSHEVLRGDIAEPTQDHDHNHDHESGWKRFSLMRFRNFSESHLGARAKLDAERERLEEERPPMPTLAMNADGAVPTIVRTAPTTDNVGSELVSTQHEEQEEDNGEVGRKVRPSLFKRASSKGRLSPRKSTDEKRPSGKSTSSRWKRGKTGGLEDLHRLSAMHLSNSASNLSPGSAPPSYGDETTSALALPLPKFADPSRNSESSRSDGSNGSSGDGPIYGSTTTTTHTVSTHTTFFRLPRRKKNRISLFPVPVTFAAPDEAQQRPGAHQSQQTPRASTQSCAPDVDRGHTPEHRPGSNTLKRRHTDAASPIKNRERVPNATLLKGALTFTHPGTNLTRDSSHRSGSSANSSPLQLPPMRLGLRNRSSTTSSFARSLQGEAETPPPRTSTSTTGRSSFGGLLNLSRFRQGSEPHSPRHGSPGRRSHADSFALSREALVIPEREEGDTPGKYLERLESAVARSVIAGLLSKSADPFAQAVLRSYTRRFPFFGEPIDMSLRKFLLEAELPKETQQVDRVIQAFADRYHECNPGIFSNTDTAYIVAFSIMMLHTDAFNKNNKRKMQKQDYVKNTSGQGLDSEILACFYDNICYTPFVHYDEDVDVNGERMLPFQSKKSAGRLKNAIPGADAVTKKPSGPVDPYNLLVEQKLDTLRPALKESIMMDDPYDYRGSQGNLDPQYLQRAFTHTGILQIISARSRPAAYENQYISGNANAAESQQGIVDLKITKVGTLWRKSAKKKKTRSPWQEWGVILTGSQLYLFKNPHWVKGLVGQFMSHQRPGHARTPVVFKPPISEFKYDALIKTDNAVALVDSTYTRHKHAFTFVRPGGVEEVLLADNENELNDWLGLINYAAAFRAAGVRIRGMVGGNEEDQRAKEVRRLDSTNSTRSVQTALGEANLRNRGLSPQLQRQVMAARRQIMVQKIGEIEVEVTDANKRLETSLRNARHLLLLAPIMQKTREDIVLAAAKKDTSISWARRDIWRMKCHRDILCLDLRLDGLSANELEKLTQDQQAEYEATKRGKGKPKMLSKLNLSKATAATSPPQSPVIAERPSVASSESFMSADIFRTPPETNSPTREDGWRLPPLNLDANTQDQHRPSITSTFLSTTSNGTGASFEHSTSTTSVSQIQRTKSITEEGSTSLDEKELELLARSTMGLEPETPAASGLNNVSPDSKHKGVRRSLHKTLREHSHHSSAHKHRRNKESESTVKSAGGAPGEEREEESGLTRDKPRFMLHGKQASVVQFGGDWERMRMRREQYSGSSNLNGASPDHTEREYHRSRSPVVRECRRGSDDTDASTGSSLSERTKRSFREDAKAAFALSSSRWDVEDLDEALRHALIEPQQQRVGSVETARRTSSSVHESEGDSVSGRANRRTIIGPTSSGSEQGLLNSLAAGIGESGTGFSSVEGEGGFNNAVSDDDLRNLSTHLH